MKTVFIDARMPSGPHVVIDGRGRIEVDGQEVDDADAARALIELVDADRELFVRTLRSAASMWDKRMREAGGFENVPVVLGVKWEPKRGS